MTSSSYHGYGPLDLEAPAHDSIPFFARVACLLARANDGWHLVRELMVPAPGFRDGVMHVESDNPRLSGEVAFVDRRYRFSLRRNGQLLWEKPAPSPWVMIPANIDLVVMIGKRYGEGTVTDGPNMSERISAFDVRGEPVLSIDVGVIAGAHLFADGRMLVLGGEAITLLDLASGGKEIWRVNQEIAEFRPFGDAPYFATGEWLRPTNEYRTTLYDATTGQPLSFFIRPFDDHPRFFAISSDRQFAMVRMRTSAAPVTSEVQVFRIGDWERPVLTIPQLEGGPFVCDRSSDGSLAIGVLTPAASALESQPRLEIRDAIGGLGFEYVCKPGQIKWPTCSLRFETPGSLLFRYQDAELIFQRAGSD